MKERKLMISEKQLNQLLLQSIAKVLPSGFQVSMIESGIQISADGRLGTVVLSGETMLTYAAGNVDRLSQSLETQLTDLQDFIAENTGLSWPGISVMPKLRVTPENGLIAISYVIGDQPVLVLDAIRVF